MVWLADTPRGAFLVIFLLAFGVGLAMLPFVPPVALVPHTYWEVMDVREGVAQRHPRTSLPDARLVQEVGEREYMRRARREALDWIWSHPGTFLSLTARRAGCFWFGSPADPVRMTAATLLTLLALFGLRHAWPALDVPQRAAFVIPLVMFPLVYYLVVYTPRYSEPLNGIVLVLAGVAAWRGTAPRWPTRITPDETLAG